jgi:hypothetical protein
MISWQDVRVSPVSERDALEGDCKSIFDKYRKPLAVAQEAQDMDKVIILAKGLCREIENRKRLKLVA